MCQPARLPFIFHPCFCRLSLDFLCLQLSFAVFRRLSPFFADFRVFWVTEWTVSCRCRAKYVTLPNNSQYEICERSGNY